MVEEDDDEGNLGWCNLKWHKHVDHLSGLVWCSAGESHGCESRVRKNKPKMKKPKNSRWPLPDTLQRFTIFSGQHDFSTFRQSGSFVNNRLLPSSSLEACFHHNKVRFFSFLYHCKWTLRSFLGLIDPAQVRARQAPKSITGGSRPDFGKNVLIPKCSYVDCPESV